MANSMLLVAFRCFQHWDCMVENTTQCSEDIRDIQAAFTVALARHSAFASRLSTHTIFYTTATNTALHNESALAP